MEHYYIAAKGVLAVKTNIKNFKWSFGYNMPEAEKADYEACKVKLHLVIEDFNEDDQLAELGKYHYFNGNSGGEKIYYTRDFAMGKKLRIKAENLLSDEPKITVNKNYYKFVTHRFMNLHSVGYILTDLATLLLLKKGYAPIHCSAFKKDGAAVAVFAPPSTGKTLSSMMACMNHGAKFIAEDLAITDGNEIFSVPWTSTFRFYSNMEQSMASKLKNKATKMIPQLEYIDFLKAKPITDYVSASSILDAETVTHVAILERGGDKVSVEPAEEAVRKILNLNRNAFHYLKSPFLTAYEFFNPGMAIEEAASNEKAILEQLVRNSEKVFSVKNVNPTDYAQVLIDQIASKAPKIVPLCLKQF
ncbi:hypothetical protein B0H99_102244 [Planomicrobium soli]|uniref:Hpr(Ser) kinase/phosphatase n=1 Tax=Planomicrobium soli TaxID=1176648 RepID=A0A2P8H5T7_9BACL|nr:hypothetical protein [Planomicrobium soli]PSL41560.1 hypothetical protein B0H99_102244 [Planomicrobium soli]